MSWILCAGLLLVSGALAQEQPYIDSIKAEIQANEPPPTAPMGATPYIEQLQEKARKEDAKLGPADQPAQGSYIEYLKQQNPAPNTEAGAPAGAWLEAEQARLGVVPVESPIADMAAGKSRKKLDTQTTESRNMFGLRVNAYASRGFTAEGSGRAFESVYTATWYPEFILFYERLLVNSQVWGSIGIGGTVGFGFFQGRGLFAHNLSKPWAPGEQFGTQSRTDFTFVSVPVFAGVSYRMNFLKYVRPYVQAMAGGLGAIETRNDSLPTRFGYGVAVAASAGANIVLNWMDPQTSFELHDFAGVSRYYLTADFTFQLPVFGQIRYSNLALSAGLTYEF